MRDRSVQRKKEGNIKYPLPATRTRNLPGLTASTFIPSPLKFQGTEAHGVTKIVCAKHFFVPQSLIGISLLYIVSRGIMKIVFGLSSIGFNYLKLSHLIRRLVFMRKVKFNPLIASHFHIFAMKQRN